MGAGVVVVVVVVVLVDVVVGLWLVELVVVINNPNSVSRLTWKSFCDSTVREKLENFSEITIFCYCGLWSKIEKNIQNLRVKDLKLL